MGDCYLVFIYKQFNKTAPVAHYCLNGHVGTGFNTFKEYFDDRMKWIREQYPKPMYNIVYTEASFYDSACGEVN